MNTTNGNLYRALCAWMAKPDSPLPKWSVGPDVEWEGRFLDEINLRFEVGNRFISFDISFSEHGCFWAYGSHFRSVEVTEVEQLEEILNRLRDEL